jgi:hypothetical protein
LTTDGRSSNRLLAAAAQSARTGEGGDGLPLLKPRRETRKIADFVAVDDNGREYVVVEWQENRVLNGRVKWIAGLKDFRLQDGSPLNQIKDTFETAETGLIIQRRLLEP